MKKIFLTLVCAPLIAIGQQAKMELFYAGKQAYENGKLSSAITGFSKAIELDSNFASAYYYRGCALNKAYPSDGLDTVTNDFKRCIALAPDDSFPEAYFYLATLIFYNNNSLSLSYLNKAIEFNPNDYRYFRERGSKKEHLNMYDEALKDYTQAISLNKKDDISYRYRYTLEWSLGMYEEAISDFEMEARYSLYTDYWTYATLLCQAGKMEKAQMALHNFNATKEYPPRTFSDLNCEPKPRK